MSSNLGPYIRPSLPPYGKPVCAGCGKRKGRAHYVTRRRDRTGMLRHEYRTTCRECRKIRAILGGVT